MNETLWNTDWRQRVWSRIDRFAGHWDMIVIGGGITGAGIVREAARAGLRCLLVEQGDFAIGTSSRSSKLVHGGLRYLKSGDWRLTLESVRERQRLLNEAPGLVEPLDFFMPIYQDRGPSRLAMQAGLMAYDLMARKRHHQWLDLTELRLRMPRLVENGLEGGFLYPDAQTDDARLVLRVLQEAAADEAQMLNYVEAQQVIFSGDTVCGVRIVDRINGRRADVMAKVVVNATGPWGNKIRGQVSTHDRTQRLRPLRGSHLVFPWHRFPVASAVTLFHPDDGRPLFAFPWEGAVVFGTTDLDHEQDLAQEPAITPAEVDYLVQAANYQFPGLGLLPGDAVSSYAGVRPVVSSGEAKAPSEESREHAIWEEKGLLTVTGGKLTTFRVTALQALSRVKDRLPELKRLGEKSPIFESAPLLEAEVSAGTSRRLTGRYGVHAERLVAEANPGQFEPIGSTPYHWAELAWAAANEGVEHLEDLMLRRTRLGLVMPLGGQAVLPRIRALCQPLLNWDDARWDEEQDSYAKLWSAKYSPVPV